MLVAKAAIRPNRKSLGDKLLKIFFDCSTAIGAFVKPAIWQHLNRVVAPNIFAEQGIARHAGALLVALGKGLTWQERLPMGIVIALIIVLTTVTTKDQWK